jgi:hypothetical protein
MIFLFGDLEEFDYEIWDDPELQKLKERIISCTEPEHKEGVEDLLIQYGWQIQKLTLQINKKITIPQLSI